MRRLPRLLVLVLFSCLMLLPSTAYAGDVYVAVRTGPEDTGTVSGGGTFADGSDVTLWWVGTYVTDWEFDHWEVSGSSVVQSYQNPYTTTVHDDGTGTVTYSAILKYSPHTHNRVYHAAVYPTCISDGTIEYYSCDTCGRMFSDYDMINEIYSSDLVWPGGSSWHDPVHVDAQKPSCESDGRVEHYWCSICQRRFYDSSCSSEIPSGSWVLPAAGHNLSNVPGKLPTCTQAGSKEYYTCSKCGKWFWDSAAAYEIPAHSTEILLDPTGHNFGPWQVTKAPTCAVDGQEERTCTDCGGSESGGIEMRTVPATGNHSWGTGTVTKQATYDADGVRTFTCSVCGATKTEAIPKLLYNVFTRCSPGYTGWVTGDGDYAKGTSVTITASPIEGYTFVKWVNTSDGSLLTTNASYTFSISSDVDATAVFEKLHVHTWREVKAKEPTCTEKGNDAYFICDECGMIVKDTTSLERIYVVPEIAALGHEWDKGKVTKEPTETAEGVTTFTCTRCGETRTEPIPATGKKTDPAPTPAPTPTPTPDPTPSPSTGIPVPVLVAGAIGLVALGALIALLLTRNRDE